MKKVLVNTYHGIGDTIFQRPFIRDLLKQGKDVYVRTPLPEFFCDMPGLKFVRSNSNLRTQKRNEQESTAAFSDPPDKCKVIQPRYNNDDLKQKSIMQAFADCFGFEPSTLMDMPSYPAPIALPDSKPIAIIRPTTERDEWCNKSRGPLNDYVDQCSRLLAARGYHCISIADTCDTGIQKEWIPDCEPFAHEKYHSGELSITQVMALIERAAVVVTGVSFALVAATAYRTPTICLLGGHGGNNHPDLVSDPRYMDTSNTKFIYPDVYCMCQSMDHNCDKTITGLSEKVKGWLDEKHL